MTTKPLKAYAGLACALLAVSPIDAQISPDTTISLRSYDFSDAGANVWELPRRLREISGLAFSRTGALLAHDDELAIVYEFDYVNGELVKAFAFGDRTADADFEGIARIGEYVYLVTSDGQIFEALEGSDGDRLLYNTYGTSAGRACEVEGLTFESTSQNLVMICKTPRIEQLAGMITLFRWSTQTRSMAQDSMLTIPLLRFTTRMDDATEFSPSGIAVHPNGNYMIIAARESAIAEVTREGGLVSLHEFRNRQHRQVEGIEIGTDGTLLLADEGRNGRARITVYRVPSS